jgi:hypothetical protein
MEKTKRVTEMVEMIGMRFEEAAELFSEETLFSMQMLSIIGGVQNGCSNDNQCTQNGCTNTKCNPSNITWTQNGCINSGCVENGCSGSTTSGSTTCP